MKTPPRRALFAISSLGLGHVTRSLAIINHYLGSGWQVTVVSSGNALEMLRKELADRPSVSFMEMVDYPPLERGTGWRFYYYLFIDLVATWRLIRYEHRQLQAIESGFDFILSDGRYGFYSRKIPSFILTHQVAFMPPAILKKAIWLTKYVNLLALRRFDAILIPDYPSPAYNLSGILSHSRLLNRYRHRHVGILSSYQRKEVIQDIDYLFVISGYLIEHKDAFVHRLLMQASELHGKKVFILGQRGEPPLPHAPLQDKDITVYPMVDGEKRQDLFNRAKLIISRAGYSTIMDLVEHDKPGLLIPTPNQTEQDYLANYMSRCGFFETAFQQQDIDLEQAVIKSARTRRFNPPWRTEQSVRRVTRCIDPLVEKAFISIIVPAHNEEFELAGTLEKLFKQDYPADRYEIVLVENGSTDSTLSIAEKAACATGDMNLSILKSEKGVSRAKNLGLAHLAPESEWVVFCDADTHLGPHFLRHLNTRLRRANNRLSVGTCQILPRNANSWYELMWFKVYDCIHRLTRTSYALQIARTSVARSVRFQVDLELAEDLLFIQNCLKHGSFFFFQTDQVSTSTRRFSSVGYLRLGVQWLLGALLPLRFKAKLKYHAIR